MRSRGLVWAGAAAFSISVALAVLAEESLVLVGIAAIGLAVAAGLFGFAAHAKTQEPGGTPEDINSWVYFVFGIDPPRDRTDKYEGLIFARALLIWSSAFCAAPLVAFCISFATAWVTIAVLAWALLMLAQLAWISARISSLS